MGNRTELTRVDKMTSKVFSIFSVYDFAIVCSSLTRFSASYSLGPETHEIIVSKISSDETVLREPFVLGHLFPFKTGLERNEQDKGNKKKLEFIVLKTDSIILVCIHSQYLIKCKTTLTGCI